MIEIKEPEEFSFLTTESAVIHHWNLIQEIKADMKTLRDELHAARTELSRITKIYEQLTKDDAN